MPTKQVTWTQQVVVASDIRYLHFDRAASGYDVSVSYDIRDASGARDIHHFVSNVTVWPTSLTALVAALNTAEGT